MIPYRRMVQRIIIAGLLCLVISPGAADNRNWRGTDTVQNGVHHIHNPAEAIEPPVTVTLVPLWRIGDNDEEEAELFGLIRDLAIDSGGNLYVVDYQLPAVRVFSPEGTYLRSIGREGEGPGEYRRPLDICIGPDSLVNVVQAYPSMLKRFTMMGDPAGTLRVRTSAGGDPVLISDIAGDGSGIVAHCLGGYPEDTGGVQNFFLCAIDAAGIETCRFYSETYRDNPASPLIRETRDYIRDRWAISAGGDVILAPDYFRYEIEVWNRNGSLARVITRDYDARARSDKEKQFKLDWMSSYREGMPPGTSFKVEDYDKDIMALYARDEGSIWILTSRGYYDRPPGSIGIFDVMDATGRFRRSVTLMGDGDPFTDRYYFLGGRLYVLRHFLDALVALRGGTEKEIAKEELEPMIIICYGLELPD